MAWQSFLATLLFLFLQQNCSLSQTDCGWDISLSLLHKLESSEKVFLRQAEDRSVSEVFRELSDSAIDPDDKDARYYGFPYHLKIMLRCSSQDSERAVRAAHYSGLRPIVTVNFEDPVNAVRQKRERLQIEMKGAPYKFKGGCTSEEVCQMCWYTPMPFVNGSVVMTVVVKSNGIGLPVNNRRVYINVNGYVEMVHGTPRFRIGKKLSSLEGILSLSDASRPLWFTYKQAPVLILGGFDTKVVLITDTSFRDFIPIEVGIDSCWIGSISCPQDSFSSSIVDTIATQSTLFIRQNQLVYYFTGHYPLLHQETEGSELWTRLLNNVCVKKLNPVFFRRNHSEFVIALGGGSQEGEFFLISCKDGVVKASGSLRQGRKTVCDILNVARCTILWAVLNTGNDIFFLLVNELGTDSYFIMKYDLALKMFSLIYEIPPLVPNAKDKHFVMLVGTERYTTTPLIPQGLSFNPMSRVLYIWGNIVLQSHDMLNYVYLSTFPSVSSIKYFVMSFTGPFAFVTDLEEIWVSRECNTDIHRVYPSDAWNTFYTLQLMQGSRAYPAGSRHSTVSLFYELNALMELVYLEDSAGKGRFVKRPFPVDYILTYDQIISTPQEKMTHHGQNYIRFTHRCPFSVLNVDVPPPQGFSRVEHYRAVPPEIMEKTGLHYEKSLMVYQGLVYQLLQLHSSYHRSYADPVHDPTWRWWKNKKEEEVRKCFKTLSNIPQEYYNYMASNWKSLGGMYVDMAKYAKIYNLMSHKAFPDAIYLDKNMAYSFTACFSIRIGKDSMGETTKENSISNIWMTFYLAHPEYVHTIVQRQELISRGSVLFWITIQDTGSFPNQDLSGRNLLTSSVTFEIANSEAFCYQYTGSGPRIRGNVQLPFYIGCPPGKRLAFDITFTKNYTADKNKRYFDCVEEDPEMPCFYFSDTFYPFFLVQDMVTGDSGRFHGSYSFTVIGGGAFSISEIQYFTPEEIWMYNIGNENGTNLIWIRVEETENRTNAEGFPVLSAANPGIMWLCQAGSPCYDIVPIRLVAPDYYFVIKVSNRGVDETTYCDYALEFIVHVHGLPLSASRSIYILEVSFGVMIGLVSLYIIVCLSAPKIQSFCNKFVHKMKENVALRDESSFTFSSSFSQGSLQPMSSDMSHVSSQTPPAK